MPPHLGGIELIAEVLRRAYLAAGCEVRWVASRVPPTLPHDEDGRIRVGCCNVLEQRFGIPWPVWGVEGIREVARLVRWADVLHVHDCLYFSSLIASIVAHRCRKPLVLSQHIGFVQYRSPILRGTEDLAYQIIGRFVLHRVSQLVFCTTAAETYLTTLLGIRPPTAITIPYGIDLARFVIPSAQQRVEARHHFSLPESGPIILFAGRFVEKKGIDLVMEVSRRLPSFHFFLVGDGPRRPATSPNVTWVPFVPQALMPTVYYAADTLLLPSHGEGMPLTILEAMATGLPVVTSRGELFAIQLERSGACLAVERQSEALCEALERLWQDPQLAEQLRVEGRSLVEREWSLEVMTQRYLQLLRDVVRMQRQVV